MKRLLFISMVIFCVSCSHTKNVTVAPNKLTGTWIPVKQEIGGKALPKGFYEMQKLVIIDSTYILTAESVDRGTVKYSGSDKIDIYGKEGVNKGKHFTGIYKMENEQLIICYNLKGDAYPAGYETAGQPLYFLSVFRKN